MENRLISLDPDQYLVFKRPFNKVKIEILRIRNITTSTVVFKVKTTAPKQYIVVPNCGEIKAGETKEIEIRLQIMSDDFAADFKCKDKFLVQSMKINDEVLDQVRSSPKELQSLLMEKFQEVDKLKKLNPADIKKILCENKLNCVYVQPTVNGSEVDLKKPNLEVPMDTNRNRNMSSGSTAPVTSSTTTTANSTLKPTEEKNIKNNILPLSFNMGDESFRCENLDEAREKIKELQKALKGYEQDKALQKTVKKEVSTNETKTAMTKPKSENVIPVEIVAIVALIAFLIGAFCF